MTITHSSTFSGPPVQDNTLYANTDGVFRANKLGPTNIETEHVGKAAPTQLLANIPAGTRTVYANQGAVVEANTMDRLSIKSIHRNN